MMIKINLPDFSFFTNYDPRSLTMIFSAFLIGIVIASAATIYRQLFLGGIVRNVLSKKALSIDTALTFEELGYKKNNIFIKLALRKKSTFRKTVHAETNEQGKTVYYIPEDISAREEIRYRKKGNGIAWIAVGVIVFTAAAFAALTLVPFFSEEIKNIIS